MSKSKLQAIWEEARDDLGLDLVIPFDLELGNGATIHADVLVKNFGCPNGMIVVSEYGAIEKSLPQIDELDYGFSVLDWSRDPYDRAGMIDMLSEWGWAGPASEVPQWVVAQDSATDSEN
jgi:hypothetical protein